MSAVKSEDRIELMAMREYSVLVNFGQKSLVVENNIEQRAVDLQSAFRTAGVINEAQFSESVHEEADSRTGGPDHLSQRLLAYLGDHSFRNAILAKMSEQ